MMKLQDFLNTLERVYEGPSKYQTGGWGKWDGSKWGWDCVCMIKGILWGWTGDTSQPKGGGAVYASNGVPDIGTEQMINVCNNVSTDFSTLNVGELVWLQGHVGVCIKAPTADELGTIVEATVGWNTNKVIKSQISVKGERTYNGKGGSTPWKKHGYLPYVDYTQPTPEPVPEPTPEPTPEFQVGDKVVPIELVNYKGVKLKQYDDWYIIMQIDKRGAVLGAPRKGKLVAWAVLALDNIKKVEV